SDGLTSRCGLVESWARTRRDGVMGGQEQIRSIASLERLISIEEQLGPTRDITTGTYKKPPTRQATTRPVEQVRVRDIDPAQTDLAAFAGGLVSPTKKNRKTRRVLEDAQAQERHPLADQLGMSEAELWNSSLVIQKAADSVVEDSLYAYDSDEKEEMRPVW